MRGLEVLVGNTSLKRRLEAGRGLSHAWILAGPPGSGKKTLAGLLSQALVCSSGEESPCGHCANCRKAKAGIHPDIIHITCEKGKDISVAQVRELRADAYVRPNEAGRKVYVVEGAHTMRGSAQNALLKLLEDGPPYAAFLLLAENAGNLLSTVRSRCELVQLAPVTLREAETWLLSRFSELPRDRVLEAACRCEGLLGRAVSRLEGDDQEDDRLEGAAVRLVELLKNGPEAAALEYCVGLEKWSREELSALMDKAVQQLRDGLFQGEEPRRSLRLIELIKSIREALGYNLGSGHGVGWLCAAVFSTR